MRTKSSKLSAAVLLLVLSTMALAAPALALDRDGARRDAPIIRVLKQLLRRFGLSPNDELGTPRP